MVIGHVISRPYTVNTLLSNWCRNIPVQTMVLISVAAIILHILVQRPNSLGLN